MFCFFFLVQSIPIHGFSFLFEMYKTPQNTYYLQLFLRQPNQEYPKAEEIRRCGKKCTLDEFYKVYEKLIPDEFEIECGVNKKDEQNILDVPRKQGSSNSAAINEISRISSIFLCSLWFICK